MPRRVPVQLPPPARRGQAPADEADASGAREEPEPERPRMEDALREQDLADIDAGWKFDFGGPR